MNWMPVWRKISARGTLAKACSMTPFGVRVAVVARVAEQRAVAAEQGEIDAPGVDADAASSCRRARQAPCAGPRASRSYEPQHVPVQRVERAHRAVGEAVDLPEPDSLANLAQHDAPALGAQIDRGK